VCGQFGLDVQVIPQHSGNSSSSVLPPAGSPQTHGYQAPAMALPLQMHIPMHSHRHGQMGQGQMVAGEGGGSAYGAAELCPFPSTPPPCPPALPSSPYARQASSAWGQLQTPTHPQSRAQGHGQGQTRGGKLAAPGGTSAGTVLTSDERLHVIEFYIPNEHAGIVIGKGGQALKELIQDCGCRIHVDRDKAGNGSRRVVVQHSDERVAQLAKVTVLQKIPQGSACLEASSSSSVGASIEAVGVGGGIVTDAASAGSTGSPVGLVVSTSSISSTISCADKK
jgi:hypothetical protein